MPDIKQQVQAAVQLPDNNPEGQMAKADLYRAAKMSIKLFQMIQDGQDLEEWVQAKITKSADYLDSIYHYMEYQMKFGGGAAGVASVDDITAELDTLTPPSEERAEEDDEELTDMEESMNYTEQLKALLEGAMIKKGIKEAKKAKPDFLDLDKDGNKKEPMKKAAREIQKEDNKTSPMSKFCYAKGPTKKSPENKKPKTDYRKAFQDQFGGSAKDLTKNLTVKKKTDESEEKRAPAKKTEVEKTLPSGAKMKTTKVQGWQSQKAEKDAKKEKDLDEARSESGDEYGWDVKEKKTKEPTSRKVAGRAYGGSAQTDDNEEETPTKKTKKVKEAAEEKRAPAKKTEREVDLPSGAKGKITKVQGWQSQKADKDAKKDIDEGKKAKPDFLDMDKDGNKKETMKKAVADKKKSAVKESAELDTILKLAGRKPLNG